MALCAATQQRPHPRAALNGAQAGVQSIPPSIPKRRGRGSCARTPPARSAADSTHTGRTSSSRCRRITAEDPIATRVVGLCCCLCASVQDALLRKTHSWRTVMSTRRRVYRSGSSTAQGPGWLSCIVAGAAQYDRRFVPRDRPLPSAQAIYRGVYTHNETSHGWRGGGSSPCRLQESRQWATVGGASR
jgi:hypothetical protein